MLAAVTWAWIAIVVSIVWKMAYGSVLYARPVMGDRWGKWVNLDMSKVDRKAAMMGLAWAVIWSIVGVVMFQMLWSWTGAKGVGDGWMVGLTAGLGLAATGAMVHPPFEQRPGPLMWFYGAYHTVEWIGVGIVFGLLA